MDVPSISAGWRAAQLVVALLGTALLAALLLAPSIGVLACWNVLIPIAPALICFAPGVWRNVCPLGFTANLARRLDVSLGRRLSPAAQGRLQLVGVFLLLSVVPLRHVELNTNGVATGVTLAILGLTALVVGALFESKSGWCAGMCPIMPVERFYGSNPLVTVPNAHCARCVACSVPCPDSVPGFTPFTGAQGAARAAAATLLVGGFPGFIWGWFHVPDWTGGQGWRHLGEAYGLPLAGLAATLTAFVALRALLPKRSASTLVRLFAASAVACYYWYRIPALFGFGLFPGDGLLVDLTASLPASFPVASRVVTTTLFAAWFVAPQARPRPWCVRPSNLPTPLGERPHDSRHVATAVHP